tara:strand:- start:8366 stop:8617 length:252 start_codon:yes stop_codon:yes gene_type:complete
MKKEIRRMVRPRAQFQCERCGKQIINAGLYEHRSQQYASDHIPRKLTVCRNCCYAESFGNKGLNLRKKNNQIEEESYLYADRD